jgi:hypothetical protein
VIVHLARLEALGVGEHSALPFERRLGRRLLPAGRGLGGWRWTLDGREGLS